MRRLSIVLSFAVAGMALFTAPAAARGPQKNDSVNGHGTVLVGLDTTYEFKVSAHAISSFTTAATGNMFLDVVYFDEPSGLTIHTQYWADVFCIAVAGGVGQVRGHVYRTEPDLLSVPTDLVFGVTDAYPYVNQADEFDAAIEDTPSECSVSPGLYPLAKGQITVNDEL